MTFHISRKRRHRRVADQLTDDLTNLIAGKLTKQSMSSIARELALPLHVVRHVRDAMKKQSATTDKRRAAELYVLSKLGKCTDAFAEHERRVYEMLTPTKYERYMSKPLAKIRVVISPSESN